MSKPYNILSLDGGGSWALIQVKCLQKLFGANKRGHEILRHFDLVAANSGGSLVLAALVANLPLPVILNLFVDGTSLPDIFAHSRSLWPLVHAVFGVGPQYSTAHKRAALEKHLVALEKETLLPPAKGRIATLCLEDVPAYVAIGGASGPHLLITTYDYNRQRSAFFRSNPNSYGDSAYLQHRLLPGAPRSLRSKAIRLLDAVHASSTAPVNFFDAPAEVMLNGQPNYLWDGGVAGYNNPVLAAVTEALTNNVAADRIRVLSIGTGAKVYPVLLKGRRSNPPNLVTEPKAHDWFTHDLRKLASAVVGAPPDAASFVAFTALNPGAVLRHVEGGAPLNPNFIRANPSIQPELVGDEWRIPARFEQYESLANRSAMMGDLRNLELDAVKPKDVGLVVKVCDAWLADELPNQPIRASNTLQCLVGQDRFSQVETQFRAVFPAVGIPPA